MRHLSFVLCASIAACGYGSLANAVTNPPLTFTLDLLGPCNTQGVCSGTHPTDINLNLSASQFLFAAGAGNAFVTTTNVNTPVVCDEIAANGHIGAATHSLLAPTFTNTTGGLLEFNAGGPSTVDVSVTGFESSAVAASYSNYSAPTLPPQVVCYQINPVSGGPAALAVGPTGIFHGGFDDAATHFAGEPWVSVQTVNAPSTGGSKRTSGTSSATPANDLVYVVQIHNPVVGWHMDFGDDAAYFGMLNNGNVPGNWCVLTSAQPGPLTTCGTGGPVTTNPNYTVAQGDIQSATNSVYLQVVLAGSSLATSNWATLSSAFFPAVASVFPPFGTYPQRFDDKVAVASGNNLPTLNIGSIVCNNDVVSTACVIRNQDGNPVPAAVTFANSISSSGTVNADPLAYVVDPNGGTTLPGNSAPLSVSNVSCVDPNRILASAIGGSNFTTSPSAQGGKALGFSFASSGSPNFPYVAGTANCTATFSASGAPVLSSTQSFTITMQQSLVGSVTLTAPAGPAAPGGNLTYTLVVANAGTSALSNVVATDGQADATFTVTSWACTGTGATCPHASGTGSLAQTIPTLPAGGSLSYAVTGTVGAIATNPVAQITNAGAISVPGGSCTGGLCSATASVATVPIISVAKTSSEPTYHTLDAVTYTITLSNLGGTPATGLSLSDAVPSGISFVSWGCVAVGANSLCPNASGGIGDLNESAIAIDAGGSVTYAVLSSVTSTGGTVTNSATATMGGAAVCAAGSCSATAAMTPGT